MKSTYLFIVIVLIAVLTDAASVRAQYYVPTPPTPSVQLFVNKLIFNPDNNQFVDNLGVEDRHFLADQEVVFRIEVKNTGTTVLTDISVVDKLPDVITLTSGQITDFSIDTLTPGEAKSFDIITKVKAAELLPNNPLTCISNIAEAKVSGTMRQDSTAFCVENKILGISTTLPKTGPSHVLIVLTGSFTLLILSLLFWIKKTA